MAKLILTQKYKQEIEEAKLKKADKPSEGESILGKYVTHDRFKRQI
jgi:hypothetical protein